MSSSRLPGKILSDILGQPMLARVFARASRSLAADHTIFATTNDSSDDQVAEYCGLNGIPFTRGSQFDVLDRFYQTARTANADIVVRITADCPVIDPGLIDQVVQTLLDGGFDFACNRLPPPWHRTFPIGLDVEVCKSGALEEAWINAREPQEREHVMPYLYEGVSLQLQRPMLETGISARGYKIALLHHTSDLGSYRWTVDTAKDLDFIRKVYARFRDRDDFSWEDVLKMVQAEPELMEINTGIPHKTLKDIDRRQLR